MNINLKGTSIELTESVKDYVLKKVTNLEKLLSSIEEKGDEVKVNFEVGRSTGHHKQGEVFHADCLVNVGGTEFYCSSDKEDLFQAVDEIKERLYEDIRRHKERGNTLFIRGARSVKKMMKRLTSRNPDTSKY